MKANITPELRAALDNSPIGPVPLEDASTGETVLLVRLSDLTHLQSCVENNIRAKLTEADADIAAGRIAPMDMADIKQRGRERQSQNRG